MSTDPPWSISIVSGRPMRMKANRSNSLPPPASTVSPNGSSPAPQAAKARAGGKRLVVLIRSDVLGMQNSIVAAALLFYGAAGTDDPRALVVLGLVAVWALRLSGYLTWRKWGEPEDHRYAAMREKHGAAFPLKSLPNIFWLQAALAWIIAMPPLRNDRLLRYVAGSPMGETSPVFPVSVFCAMMKR